MSWTRAALGEDAHENDLVAPLQQNYAGLARWITKRDEATGAAE